MYRDAEIRVQEWIDNSKKALLIYGARQVGKTWLIREMLGRNRIPYFEVNLLERQDILNRLNTVHDAGEMIDLLKLYSPQPLEDRKAVVFLDEIQVYPDILTKIKFMVDDGRLRYILSGSNLGIELKGLHSAPIGYVEQWQMFPMTLYEFSLALGAKQDTLAHLKECYEQRKPVDEVIHRQMIRSFYTYLMTGGMPAVVETLVKQSNLSAVDAEQKNIINQYKADFIKYEAENRRLKIISVYDSIPSQLNKQNRRFVFTYLNKELKFDRYEESFLWLKDAAVAIPVFNAQAPVLPLEQSRSSNLFKLYQSDVGLLTACYPAQLRQEIMQMNPDTEINFGSLFENYVACEMYANGLKMLYYKSVEIGEIDYLLELDGRLMPLEVKSGKDYRRHKALDHLLSSTKFNVNRAIVLSLNNTEQDGNILYLPIYMAPLLHNSIPTSNTMDIGFFNRAE